MCCETALGVTLSSAAARTKLPSRALASKALSAFRGGSLRDMGVFRRRRFSFSTRRGRWVQDSYTNSVGGRLFEAHLRWRDPRYGVAGRRATGSEPVAAHGLDLRDQAVLDPDPLHQSIRTEIIDPHFNMQF